VTLIECLVIAITGNCVFYCFYEQIKCMYVCNVTSLVHSYIVITAFSKPSFRAIASALWSPLVLLHSCSYLSSCSVMNLLEWNQ